MMRSWRSWTWVMGCCVMVLVGCGGPRPNPDLHTPEIAAKCIRDHGFAPETSRTLETTLATQGDPVDDCPIESCGMNGTWLGRGVAFRTLHLDKSKPNRQGVRIKAFQDAAGAELTLIVKGNQLVGVRPDGARLEGPQLTGSQLILAHAGAGHPDDEYVLQFAAVDRDDFWTECRSQECPTTPETEKALFYRFTVTSKRDGCQVELCKPGLGERVRGSGLGTAVIFQGDYYDEKKYAVLAEPPPGDEDVFNIACVGTLISKLHLMRHTAASEDPPHQTGIEERQTLLRLLAADYCGIGRPFTEDGTPIRFDLRSSRWLPTRYAPFPATSVTEASWTSGGASCLGVPRWGSTLTAEIRRVCEKAGHDLSLCSAGPPTLSALNEPGQYAISGSP